MDDDKKKLDLFKKEFAKGKTGDFNVDLDAVQNIVDKMKKKDKKITPHGPVSESHLKEIRDIIEQGKLSKLNIDTETKLVGDSESTVNVFVIEYSRLSALSKQLILY